MKCLFLLPTLLLAVSGTTTCKTGSDCSMNGICYVDRCVCEAGWTGTHCDQMSLKPANLKGGYDSPHNGGKTSSWGGGILKINGTFHMYAAEMMNFCGIESWEPNSRVVHATSKNAVGPYTFQSEVLKPFAHEPNVVMSPTGEIVIYVTLRHPDGYELANCTEPEPIVPFAPEPPGPCGTPPPRSTYMIYSSNPYGPWSEPELVLKANDSKWANCPVMVDTNLAVAIREDGSALGIWRKCTNKPGKCESDCCTFPHLLHASDWKDPSTYVPSPVPMFPNMAAYGSEDPFVWIDETFNTTFHAIFHDEQGVSRTSSNGYHAFSIDNGNTWTYASNAAYNASVVTTNGTVQFARRERPHLILENGIPTHVTNGVQEDDAPTNCHEDAQCYRSYTLIQAFNEQ